MTTTTHPEVAVDSIWNRKTGTTGRVEVLEAIQLSGENWVRVRHLDMPADRTKTWWAMEKRFLRIYEPVDL